MVNTDMNTTLLDPMLDKMTYFFIKLYFLPFFIIGHKNPFEDLMTTD